MSLLDVAIVGAGPVGATLAALAAREGLEVAVFEARAAPSADRRTLALSHGSRERLEEAGAWPADAATPILSIHVSQKGGPGRTLIEARDQRLPALGYTVSYSALEGALSRRLEAARIPVHYGHTCEAIAVDPAAARLRFAGGAEASARLLVLADGGANATKIPGIAFHEKDYGQHAVVGAVRADRPHGGRAYERFTPRGPMALLPVDDRFALVWTASPAESARLLGLGDAEFVDELQGAFGDRAGRFSAMGPRASFPLKLRAVNTPVALRTAIIGNAAQALHPIAGQGLNLGLRDAGELAGAIAAAPRASLGDPEMLAAYREARRRDASRGVAFTDLLVSAFADARRLPTWGRGLALTALDLFAPARRALAERMIHGAPAP
ncbi:MAG TPA: FAD-dependent oxidoreductase [Usitatibacter sp.]|nr:FAD-dependent oxidoreductase [Usitatibacter sp.]